MQSATLLALMINQFFHGVIPLQFARPAPVRITQQRVDKIMAQSSSPLDSAILAGSSSNGFNYVCWFRKSRVWYRVDCYQYRHLYVRAVVYHSFIKVWDIQNGKLTIDSAYSKKLTSHDNIWGTISYALAGITAGRTSYGLDPTCINLPELNEETGNSVGQLHIRNQRKNAKRTRDETTYYLQDASPVNPDIIRLFSVSKINQRWIVAGDLLVVVLDYNVKAKQIDKYSLEVYSTSEHKGSTITENLSYLQKNVSISENIFSHPEKTDK